MWYGLKCFSLSIIYYCTHPADSHTLGSDSRNDPDQWVVYCYSFWCLTFDIIQLEIRLWSYSIENKWMLCQNLKLFEEFLPPERGSKEKSIKKPASPVDDNPLDKAVVTKIVIKTNYLRSFCYQNLFWCFTRKFSNRPLYLKKVI